MSDDLPEAPKRYKCGECDHLCDEPLVAANPFDPSETIMGCPSCRSAESLIIACCIQGCRDVAAAGVPGAHGYRYAWLCGDHYLEWNRRQE